MRLLYRSRVGLNTTRVAFLQKEKKIQACVHTQTHMENTTRILESHCHKEVTEAEERPGTHSKCLPREHGPAHPSISDSGLQNCELFKVLSLGQGFLLYQQTISLLIEPRSGNVGEQGIFILILEIKKQVQKNNSGCCKSESPHWPGLERRNQGQKGSKKF